MSANCLFCKIIAGQVPANKVYEDETVFAFRDINPVAPTHILVVPREHLSAIDRAEPRHEAMLGALMRKAGEIASAEGLAADGFRLVINTGRDGGQTVFHLHVHILGGRALGWPPG